MSCIHERDAHLTFAVVCRGRGVMEQFRVDPNSIGMIVGKSGANIKKAQALPGVHRIDIRQDGMISIVADTPQAGKDARSMLEVTQEKVKIQPQEVRVQGAPPWVQGFGKRPCSRLLGERPKFACRLVALCSATLRQFPAAGL